MKNIAWVAVVTAVSLLACPAASLAGDDSSADAGVHHPWAKVVVNHPVAKHGAYYKGISPTAFATSGARRPEGGQTPH